jgi:hypothetical protein
MGGVPQHSHVFRSLALVIWARSILILLLSGCTATRVMVGVSEPDLSKIQLPSQRSQVERALGDRLWRAGLAEGLIYDIYEYKEARPASPALGAVWLGVDVLMFGLLTEARGIDELSWPVKQVAVAYDAQDRVVFVSHPWSVHAGPPCRRMRSVLAADSGVPSTARPAPMADRPAAGSEVAVLKLDWLETPVRIDGRQSERRVIELPPGPHNVSDAEVDFLPGRVYRLKREKWTVGTSEWETIRWIEDVDSGETLHCFPSQHSAQ